MDASEVEAGEAGLIKAPIELVLLLFSGSGG